MHGHGKEVVNHFEWMCEKHVELDNTTFVCYFCPIVTMCFRSTKLVLSCFSDHRLALGFSPINALC
jgi:hypothetical protein